MDKDTTLGLSPEKIARLLGLGIKVGESEEGAEMDRTAGEALAEMLAREFPADADVRALRSQTIGEVLLDSKTGVAALKMLKDSGKALVRKNASEKEKAAATAVYYAAIAGALVFRDHKITQLSYDHLDEGFAKLEKKPWVSPELKTLFARARTICQRRFGGSETTPA